MSLFSDAFMLWILSLCSQDGCYTSNSYLFKVGTTQKDILTTLCLFIHERKFSLVVVCLLTSWSSPGLYHALEVIRKIKCFAFKPHCGGRWGRVSLTSDLFSYCRNSELTQHWFSLKRLLTYHVGFCVYPDWLIYFKM